MRRPLNVLHVEDSEADVILVERHLAGAGYDLTSERVDTAKGMKAALQNPLLQVVLCDYTMPEFDALKALRVLRASGRDIPLIIISGTVGEEHAVQALLDGAHDYIPKANLTRLGAAIQRELKEAENRRERREAVEALRRSEERYHTLFEYAPDGIIVSTPEDYYLDANASMCQMLGYDRQELVGMHAKDIVIRSEVRELDSEFELVQAMADYNREWHFKRKDGSVFPAEVIATIMPDGNLLAMIRDVTERKQAEEKLRESEEKFSGAFEFASIGVALVLPDGRTLKVNRALCDLIGYTEAELLSLTFQDVTHPDDLEEDLENLNRLLSGEIPDYQMEKRYIHKLGDTVHALLHVSLVRHANGDPRYFISHVEDITAQKAAESQLQLHSVILNSIGQSVIVTDAAGTITYWNSFAETMYGWRSSEAVGRNVIDVTPTQATRARGVEILDALMRGEGWSGEFTVQNRAGTAFPIFVTNTPLMNAAGEVESIIGISVDVTERKKAEAELRESEALLAASQRITHLGSWVMDISESGEAIKHTERWSDEHYRIFGFEPGEVEITDEMFYGSVHSDDREPLAKVLRDSIEHQRPYDLEHRIILPDGTERIVHAMAEVVIDDKTGKVTKLLGSVQDITERKRIEKDIERRQTELRALFDVMPAMVWFKDTENNLLRVNQRVADAAGLAVEEIEGKPAAEIYPDESAEFFADDLKVLESGKPKLGYEEMLPGLDCEKRWVQTDKVPYFDNDGKPIGIVVMAQDVTERKNAEQALRESDEKFHQLADNINDSFWIRSPDLKEIHYISPAFEKIWGRSLEVVYATPHEWLNFILPEDREYVRAAYERLMDSSPTIDIEYRIVRGDDEVRWVRTRGFQVRNADGELIRLAGIVTDITESKKAIEALGESEERYRELVENALDIIYTHDLKGNYTSANKAAERITGYSSAEILSMNIGDTIPPEQLEKAKAMIAAKLAGKEVTAYELELLAKDGHGVQVEVNTRIIHANGVPVGVQGIARDITERKRTEAALEESEASFKSLFHTANDAIMVISDGLFNDCNPSTERLFGCTKEWIIGRSPDELSPELQPDGILSSEKVPMYIVPALQGIPQFFGWQHRRKDGTLFDAEVSLNRVEFHGESQIQAIVRDITERKQAEKEIALTLQRLKDAQRIGQIGDFTWDKATDAIIWSHEIFEIVGRDPKLGPPKDYEQMQECFDQTSNQVMDAKTHRAIETGKAQEYELVAVRPDGERVYIQAMSEPIKNSNGTIVGLRGTLQNISTRKQAEAALEQSELRYHSLFENMLEGYAYCETIFEGDRLQDFIYTEVNGAFEKLTGLTDVVGKRLSEVIPGGRESVADVLEIYGRVALTGTPEKVETYLQPLDIWLSITVYSSSRENFVAVFDNITERKRAQTLLIESQRSLSLATESASLGIWDWDLIKETMKWDARMYDLYGNHDEDFSGSSQTWKLNLHPEDIERVYAEFAAAIEGPKDFHSEFRVVWPSGEVRQLESSAKILRDEKGTALNFIGVNWDITDRKGLEEQYRQSQKMEAVGVLAGGIAHDFNNLLTAINGYSDLTLRKMVEGDPLRRNIEEVKKAGDRATELTTQLLAFSRKQVLKPIVLNLNTVISTIEKMLRRIIKESIELRVVLGPDLGNIKADPGQIEQVLMNLAINARDAMEGGGMLTVETKNVYLDERYISQHLAVTPGNFIRLTVTDNGHGMDAATRQHIFEPFFTTKEVGKGTGLGLSTVYGIVKQSGGDIMVYSEPGHGTTFKIYFPSVDESIRPLHWSGEHAIAYSGTETILVAEDEEIVRTLVCEILTDNGYKVLAAAGGQEALEICSTYTEPIHLLLTDVIMPKMGGSELREKVVKRLPNIKVMFMSGYTDDSMVHHSIAQADIAFLEKPFTPESLARKVREALEQ